MRKNDCVLSLFSLFLLLGMWSCRPSGAEKEDLGKQQKSTELSRIMKSGKLRAVVDYNSTNYFIYKGSPMGFKFEILQHLANDMGLKLEVSVSNSIDESFQGLREKKYDLIAKNLTITKARVKQIDFTTPLEQTRQVLVQRRPENWHNMAPQELEDSLIRSQLDLAGKTIYIQRNTVYYQRLSNLSDEIGAEINLVEDTVFGVEQLVGMVSRREIDYTVCDENVANVNQSYFPNLDVATPVSFEQNIAWAVRQETPEWRNYLNNWISNFKQTKEFARLHKKYFESDRLQMTVLNDYHSLKNGAISPYDNIIKQKSKLLGIDWRLTAAIIYQESGFDPTATSWAGATGLMQVMPESADLFQIYDYAQPDKNIEIGVRLLKWLDDNFRQEVPDSLERMKFVLAAYNVGLGHVKDAQRLAAKYHKIPIVWTNNVDYFLLNKSASKYYKDPVVKYGYCRGEEPFDYVNRVLATYHHYVNLIGTSQKRAS